MSLLVDYANEDFIDYHDVRGVHTRTIETFYNDCYQHYISDYDWIFFADADEFLTFVPTNMNVKEFLPMDRFKNFDMIAINWLTYGDNNLIHYDPRPCLERFMKPVSKEFDRHVRSFVKPNKDMYFVTVHMSFGHYFGGTSAGEACYFGNPSNTFLNYEPDGTLAYIKHFWTKTAEEFCLKIIRSKNSSYVRNMFDFYNMNKRTPEKDEVFKKYNLYIEDENTNTKKNSKN